ncbi:helicase-related protein [Streptosporangium sp. NPDC087985]|uniref:helicase-related protein n=1 Tax=Streptosporangium sp. NPDC087985 TaxID=3366196 RepID=UPI0037F17330
MTNSEAHYRFRRELADRLQKDILGPVGGDEEILIDAPATAYIAGVLYPRDADEERSTAETTEQELDLAPTVMAVDEKPDAGAALANRQMPSAMGLTFAVDTTQCSTINLAVSVAVYDAINEEGRVVKAQRAERRATQDDKIRWRRRPLAIEPVQVKVTESGNPEYELVQGLQVRLRVREIDDRGVVAVTATLINLNRVGPVDIKDAHCFFQPVLKVTAEGGRAAFVERQVMSGSGDEEVLVSRLLHRHAPMFATGHGCAADWEWEPPSPRGPRPLTPAATEAVWTAVAPMAEVLLTSSNPDIEELGMQWLANADGDEVFQSLRRLTDGYLSWINARAEEAEWLGETDLGETAQRQIEACKAVCARIERGIELLERDPNALRAFQLANQAMARQRARTAWIKGGRAGKPNPEIGRWYPFQIGFVLLCLEGIANPKHKDRRIADLLWFPTGGGKTEAYLGLIAFTVFLRRIRGGAQGGGVTVLMRYTLRLLTLQQFERAATLMCAMELMREKDRTRLGEETISLGMWVGKAATPNTLKDAEESIEKLRGGKKLSEMNPVQLRSCPWCGTVMDAFDYHAYPDSGTMSIQCRNADCDFRNGLPVHVVDQAIYKARPTLIIATADKFAQITWRSDVAKLFNRDDAPEGTPPPELIIQDELHLISGPLGTLAGLYETAIDIASDFPKVIASTATIRRAKEQGARLFDRDVSQFPPAGLDARDSWFAVEAPPDRKASRMYIGLLTASTSQATLLIRAYAALLHYAAFIKGDEARDAYWTLVGYFNSLRLLAAAELQIHADVDERLKQLANRDETAGRMVKVLGELTSRVDSSEIPKNLEDLSIAWPEEGVTDAVLATNMISVGVDVNRLGLMAVTGQPQTTAEYIQATSRVGRQHPGLVVALLNSARSRDRSHYENFTTYHSALYRQVESTSVTPFAARARDRALHAVLVGLARMCVPAARMNADASQIGTFLDEVLKLKNDILQRVRKISEEEYDSTAEELDDFIEHWQQLAEDNPGLLYEAPRRVWAGQIRHGDTALLSSYGSDEDLLDAIETMWSLRDVDVESDLYLEK